VSQLQLPDGQKLRLLKESDAEELYAVIDTNRDYLARWLPWAANQTLEHTLAFIRRTREQMTNNDGFQTTIIDDGKIVGMVGFVGVSWQHRSTMIGYWLSESAQGNGVMTYAVQSLTGHAFETWRLNRVEIRAGVENTRSRSIPERLEFQQEGVLREAELVGDRYVDQAVYAKLACDWLMPGQQRL
jgi:ribosomal-protein-serine acetyltransferase